MVSTANNMHLEVIKRPSRANSGQIGEYLCQKVTEKFNYSLNS